MNRILRVTPSHPYIDEGGANSFLETRRLVKEPLEATWTVQKRLGHILARWSTPELVCSLEISCPVSRAWSTWLYGI